MEFPICNQDAMAHKNRFVYCAHMKHEELSEEQKTNPKALADSNYNCVCKFDLQGEKIEKLAMFGEDMNGGETFYYQRDGSDWRKNGEDDGYLFNVCHNWREDQAYLMVWDAKTMNLACKAKLQTR